jgi:ATP-dependent RNA helicase DeaD
VPEPVSLKLDAFLPVIGEGLSSALRQKGYETLTAVQAAVLDPALAGRDLRITSQTGSGKTVAIGLVLRDVLTPGATAPARPAEVARPRALVVVPTRELARQVEEELSWLYAPLGVFVTTTTGGASARDERRALGRGPQVIVGTPGRLLDHLSRHSIDTTALSVVVLDEADRMLDLGFRDDLKAILAHAPEGHQTHLMSATFPREVKALADGVQHEPAHVEGTRLGAANSDIDHLVHIVDPGQHLDAIVNLLLVDPEAQTLVFARTRVEVAKFAKELAHAGFKVGSLSGEMDQVARNRALAGLRRGEIRVLVATDVAARGIDVQDIARVIHAEPSTDADSYTHRSGRTGRAGRKGTSSLLVSPSGVRQATRLLERAKVTFRIAPLPSAADLRQKTDARLLAELSSEAPSEGDASAAPDERTLSLARQLVAAGDTTHVIARLLMRARTQGQVEPRELRAIAPPAPTSRPARAHEPRREPREPREPRSADHGAPPPPRLRAGHAVPEGGWVSFRVTWGQEHGADARRIMAIACRRGQIRGSDVGAIRVGPTASSVEVASGVAAAFAEAVRVPDPRDPRVLILPEGPPPPVRRPPPSPHARFEHRRPVPARTEPHKTEPRKAEHRKTEHRKGQIRRPEATGEHPKPAPHKPYAPRPHHDKAPPRDAGHARPKRRP